jgi:hypothetical protein
MRIISNLDDKPKLLDDINLSAEVLEKIPTYRQLLKVLISNVAAKSPDEALDLFAAGLKILEAKDPGVVKLEDSQFRHLHNKARDNELKWTVPIHAQLMQILNSADKEPAKD